MSKRHVLTDREADRVSVKNLPEAIVSMSIFSTVLKYVNKSGSF